MRASIRGVLVLVAGLLFASVALADDLTRAQRNTLRAAILAEPALQAFLVSPRQDDPITDYCNAPVTPAQLAWKPRNTAEEIFAAVNLNEYIARSAPERQAFDLLLQMAGAEGAAVNATRASTRSAIVNIFSGATNSTSRAAVLTAMTEPLTWCQSKLGGNSATTDTVTAVRRNWAGTLVPIEVSRILNGD